MRFGHDSLRTKAATLAAAAAALKHASGISTAPFALAFLTDRRRIPYPEPILRALPVGAAVIYRDYDDPKRGAVARRYLSICRGRGLVFLVAGDPGLARAIGADGVHLPGHMLASRKCSVGRSGMPEPSHGLLTAACHDAADLRAAFEIGADAAFLAPVFPTQSHPHTEPLGIERFRDLAGASALPVLALGGVDAPNAGALAARNVAGFAAISAFS
jgi:thiamine monophosphate synthase